jgi:pyruvate,water dikinase
MLRKPPYILWFEESGRKTFELVGGKGASLGEMTQAGIRVPPGFSITTQAYIDFLNEAKIKKAIFGRLKELDLKASGSLEAIGRDVRNIILESSIPKKVEIAIRDAYSRLAEKTGVANLPVAVRSSATAEDLPDASFAGQQDTYLWITGEDDVVKHTRDCWASLFSDRAIAYRINHGFTHEREKICVVVQKMVHAKSAGVMFTLNPINGDISKISVNASWGLGESVVSGTVTPDEFLVDKVTFDILKRTISAKEIEHRVNIEKNCVDIGPIPDDRKSAPSITDDELLELSRVGKRIEIFYKGPSDIEWAVDADLPFPDGVVILQARPETVWSQKRKKKQTEKKQVDAMSLIAGSLAGAFLQKK